MTVGIVVVSHSADVATGVRALALQMAPDVTIVAAGGADDGSIGTSFELIEAALDAADDGAGVVVLYDLGSTLLTAEMALEMADPDVSARREIVDAPLVEGAIAAAVAAQGGADRAAVIAAARQQAGAGDDPAAEEASAAETPADEITADVRITNPLGLHARPAASLARLVSAAAGHITVARPGSAPVDLRSVMSVVGLATRQGDLVRLAARGQQGRTLLDQVATAIREGFGEADDPPPATASAPRTSAQPEAAVGGAPGAPGMAMGQVLLLGAFPDELPTTTPSPADDEEARLTAAVSEAAQEFDRGDSMARAHAAMLRDPQLLAAAVADLARGAAAAWWGAVGQLANSLAATGDEVTAARAVDVREAGAAVLSKLGVSLSRIDASVAGRVVIADDMGPGDVTALVHHQAAAAVLRQSSPTAHAVVVARGLGLPLVIHAQGLAHLAADSLVVIDGDTGEIQVDPPEDAVVRARARVSEQAVAARAARADAANPVSYEGRSVLISANVGSLADAEAAVANGADGVGLLRTELLVLDRAEFPDEDTQVRDLRQIFEVLRDRPTVVRVLDVGGDKPVRTLDVGPEHHGFLGVRGLRYLLAHPELLHTQLRAICRAAVGHAISVMAPMVTTPQEAREFRAAVDAAVASLREDNIDSQGPASVGIMIEVPAAALTIREFAEVVDFVSIGSNDLLAYLVAADRTEPGVAHLLDPDSIAFARLCEVVAQTSREADLPFAVCGEIAGDPATALRLLGAGAHELSMAPARIPVVKKAIRDR